LAFPSIKASAKGGKDFELVPVGVHLAICTQVIHLGVQPSNNPKYPDKDQVYLKFEIPGVRVKWEKNGKELEGPAVIGTFFTRSLSEKSNFRPFLESWRGKPFSAEELEAFELTALLGKVCQLNVIHEQKRDGKDRAEISGAFGLIQLQKDQITQNPELAKPAAPLVAYTPDAHDQSTFDALPEWLQKKIDGRVKVSPKVGKPEDESQVPEFNDDIPF
jgi:hypothetical protein